MEFKPEITKEFVYSTEVGGNVVYQITPYTLYEFFNNTSKLKKIPSYQRPYSWQKNNVEEFLDDILRTMVGYNSRESWFLGSIYVTKLQENQQSSMILDGQQRITTLQIILNELRLSKFYLNDLIFDNGFDEAAVNAKSCLFWNSAGKLIPRFSTDEITNALLKKYLDESLKVNDYETYEEYEKTFEEEISTSISKSKSHRSLYDNINIVKKFINELIKLDGKYVKNYKDELSSHTESQRIEYFINTILYRLWLINIPLVEENASVEIFESLNNRGKPLSLIDKIQFKSLTKGFVDEKSIKDNWAKLFESIDNLRSKGSGLSSIFSTDEYLLKIYLESIKADEIKTDDEYLEFFSQKFLTDEDKLKDFFRNILRVAAFLKDISVPDDSKFLELFKDDEKKKVRGVTSILLSFLNKYQNPIRLLTLLISHVDFTSEKNKYIIVQGVWEILKLAYYFNLFIGRQPNRVREDFHYIAKHFITLSDPNFSGLFKKIHDYKLEHEDDEEDEIYKGREELFRFKGYDGDKFTFQGILSDESSILNSKDNKKSLLVLLLYVYMTDFNKFSQFSISQFSDTNLEHIMPRSWKAHWTDAKYSYVECKKFAAKDGHDTLCFIINNVDQDEIKEFELKKYDKKNSIQEQSLIEWIGNKLLIDSLPNKEISNFSYEKKFKAYDTEEFVLPRIKNSELNLEASTNFNHELIMKRSMVIIDKLSIFLNSGWDTIDN